MSVCVEWIMYPLIFNSERFFVYRYGMQLNLAKAYALYAEWFKRKGNPSKARENLSTAIEILKECGADGWVEMYET